MIKWYRVYYECPELKSKTIAAERKRDKSTEGMTDEEVLECTDLASIWDGTEPTSDRAEAVRQFEEAPGPAMLERLDGYDPDDWFCDYEAVTEDDK